MPEDKNRATAAALLPLVGGAENLTSIAHCMTRLRLGIRDRSLVQDEALRALPAVMGVVEDDTYQIVLGPGTVARVTPEFERLVEQARTTTPEAPAPPVSPRAPAPAPSPASASPSASPPLPPPPLPPPPRPKSPRRPPPPPPQRSLPLRAPPSRPGRSPGTPPR